ncbi:retrovirus-related Pol polyprotein from transposon 17.6 [Trichonephila clavipes]|nr:retrovirus-related Pol polyprotein from transposon 17.6 [Trichonephila clavipes]
MSILRDTGATVDVICQKYVDRDRMKGEQVWVRRLLDDHMTCLPVAEVDIECDLGTESDIQCSGDREPLGSRVNDVVTRSQTRQSKENEIFDESDQNDEQTELNLEEGTENLENEEILPPVDCCSLINPLTQIKSSTFIAEEQKNACGPIPISTEENKYLITVMCLTSKYPDAIPGPDIASKSVVNALLQVFSWMGFPREIQTDQGTSFMSRLTVEFFNRFGIKVSRSSVYHPQSNPVEHFHRTVKRVLRVLCIEAAPNWESQVPAALFALRTVTHESTGFSPAELVYGNNLRTPVTLLYESWLDPEEKADTMWSMFLS